jgi:hypothetical protein
VRRRAALAARRPRLVGHLFPRLLAQSEYDTRLRQIAPLMEAALRWLADATPATAEQLRLMDATPVPCGTSAVTAKRSDLFGYAGYGYCASHSRWYWGCKLLLICTCDGTVTGFSLANPKLHGERDQARQTLERQPANRPAPGTAVVTDKGLSGQETEEFFAGDGLNCPHFPINDLAAGLAQGVASEQGAGQHLREPLLVLAWRPPSFADQGVVGVRVCDRPHDVGGGRLGQAFFQRAFPGQGSGEALLVFVPGLLLFPVELGYFGVGAGGPGEDLVEAPDAVADLGCQGG